MASWERTILSYTICRGPVGGRARTYIHACMHREVVLDVYTHVGRYLRVLQSICVLVLRTREQKNRAEFLDVGRV